MNKDQTNNIPIVELKEDIPLRPAEQRFITEYLKTGNKKYAVLKAEVCDRFGIKIPENKAVGVANQLLNKPNVQAEINRIMDELKNESVATAQEVMAYFTEVMRGNLKDQFGLDASLSERTRAAQELAKRTVDVEMLAKKTSDSTINVTINWDRDNNKEDDDVSEE